MKVRRQLAALDDMVLVPLRSLEGEDWHRTVPGKWSIVQIVRHLSIGIDFVAAKFEEREDKRGMKRRASPRQTLLRHVMLGLGRLPSGRDAPEGTVPEARPDPEATLAQFRMGVARLETLVDTWLPKRQVEVYVKNPVLGDLNLPEWARFHYVHCRHHLGQLRTRLRWLEAKKAVGR